MKLSYAVQEILSFAPGLPARHGHTDTMVVHTNGGGPSLHSYFEQRYRQTGERICSQLQVMKDGAVHQYVDTDQVAYAAYAANDFAVHVETEDDGNPGTPWTEPQLASLVRIAHDLRVPGIAASETGHGIGGHNWYGSWNRSNHACPGDVRNSQLRHVVIPRVAGAKPAPAQPGHPGWPATMNPTSIRQWQTQMAHRGWKISVDGVFGSQSADVAGQFQAEKKLTVTRRLDHPTWDAAWTAPVT